MVGDIESDYCCWPIAYKQSNSFSYPFHLHPDSHCSMACNSEQSNSDKCLVSRQTFNNVLTINWLEKFIVQLASSPQNSAQRRKSIPAQE